jgi:hypothetical protein
VIENFVKLTFSHQQERRHYSLTKCMSLFSNIFCSKQFNNVHDTEQISNLPQKVLKFVVLIESNIWNNFCYWKDLRFGSETLIAFFCKISEILLDGCSGERKGEKGAEDVSRLGCNYLFPSDLLS